MEVAKEHNFSLDRHYLFIHKRTNTQLTLIVCKPLSMCADYLFFRFKTSKADGCELVAKKDIIAVGNMASGTLEVEGWKGKYQVMNGELFYKYCLEEVIKLKE
jgi:hypothetical protein